MKLSSLRIALICSLIVCSSSVGQTTDKSDQAKLDVLKMKEIPAGHYNVQLQFAGENHTVKMVINRNRAAFVKTTTGKLEGLSGRFELIGNGVFMVSLVGKSHRATQWWIFHPDGTASIKETPDRGEKQTAKPTSEKQTAKSTSEK